jgi:radical SAM superfamily enzyme YgiQ (UPF0313 family)
MKVLLVQPPLEDFYTTAIRLYPLGLLYAAAVLEKAGCTVEIQDCLSPLRKHRIPIPEDFAHLETFLGDPCFFKGYYRFGVDMDRIVRRVKDLAPDIIGISSQFTAYYKSVEEIVRLVKRNSCSPVFIGGNHATAFPQEIKERTPEIDDVLIGPAEDCLPEYLERRGLTVSQEKPNWTRLRPAHHLLQPTDYKIGRRNYVSLMASRGCPFRCDFCSVHRMFGRSISYRPVESVLEEMRWNYIQKNVRIFNFEDDNLSYDREWFWEFLWSVKEDPLLQDVELTAMNGLCSSTLDESLLPSMVQAGFRRLNLSFVTQSRELKSEYHRPLEGRDFESFIRAAQKLGLFVTVYVIIGLPGQTFEEAKDSIDYLCSLGVLVGPSIFYLPPASPLYERLSLPPAVKNNWNLYRSSAFAVETDQISRGQLVELFVYARRKNLENKNQLG